MWRTKKLSQVCDIQSGLWKGKKEPFTEAFVLRNTNFTAGGKFDYSDVALLQVETKQLEKRTVLPNDIILEKSGGGEKTPVGRVCLHTSELDKPVSLSNFTARLRVINEEELTPSFLHRFLYFLYISGKTEPMQRNSTGIRNLQISQYKDIEVPLPPLAEQQRIVAKLDAAFAEIDRAIHTTKINIQNYFKLEETNKSSFFSNLSSSLIELEKTSEIINGYAFKSGDFQNSNGVPVIKITNVGIRDFVETNDVNLPKDFLAKHKQFTVNEGDIVFALTRTVINGGLKVAVVPKNYDGALLNQRVASVSANPKLMNSEFLYSYLSSSTVLDYVLSNVNTLMQPNLSITDLKKLPVPNIPVDKQVAYCETLKETEIQFRNIRNIKTKKISELEKLKSAILAQELQSEAA